jgi:hypothetical protein
MRDKDFAARSGRQRERVSSYASRPAEVSPGVTLPVDAPPLTNTTARNAALEAAQRARTPKDFNNALNLLLTGSGLSQGEILRRDAESGRELTRSTVSRMVRTAVLCSRAQQVEAFVSACGDPRDIPAWIEAWRDVRKRKQAAAADLGFVALLETDDRTVTFEVRIHMSINKGTIVGIHEINEWCPVCNGTE